MDSEFYLEPGFDSTTLRVAELRGILLKYDVDYPSSSKKAELLALYNQHIASQAENLRKASSLVRPSYSGMVDALSKTSENETKRARRSTRVPIVESWESSDQVQSQTPASRPKANKTPPRKTDNGGLALKDLAVSSTARKTRRSLAIAHPNEVSRECVTEEHDQNVKNKTAFSSHNPFQMGSSPLRSKSSERSQRKSIGSTIKRRSTSDVMYENDLPNAAERHKSASGDIVKQTTPEGTSHRHLKKIQSDFDSESEVSPEEGPFPEGEAVRQEWTTDSLTSRRRKTLTQPFIGHLSVAMFCIMLAWGVWWRREKIEAGYCGVGGLEIKSPSGGAIAEFLRPECEPCPYHATCFPGMQLRCDNDYVEIPKLLSMGGTLPIPPDCVPDTEKERRKSIMSNAALEILRENSAEQRCKERFLRSDELVEGLSEQDLRKVLYDRKSGSLSDKEFSELWRLALDEVSTNDEVTVDTANGHTTFKSNSLSALPIGCSIRHFLARSLVEHRVSVIGLALSVIVFLRMKSLLQSRNAYSKKVAGLVQIALTRLSQNSVRFPNSPAIAVAHLRDQLLQHEFNTNKRKHFWEGVEKIVEMNSNVRAGEQEIQGEVMRVWTWIGGKFSSESQINRNGETADEHWNHRPVA